MEDYNDYYSRNLGNQVTNAAQPYLGRATPYAKMFAPFMMGTAGSALGGPMGGIAGSAMGQSMFGSNHPYLDAMFGGGSAALMSMLPQLMSYFRGNQGGAGMNAGASGGQGYGGDRGYGYGPSYMPRPRNGGQSSYIPPGGYGTMPGQSFGRGFGGSDQPGNGGIGVLAGNLPAPPNTPILPMAPTTPILPNAPTGAINMGQRMGQQQGSRVPIAIANRQFSGR